MPPLKDLTGQRFGKLVVLQRAENKGIHAAWICRCDCGNEKVVNSTRLITEKTKSCGCLFRKVHAEKKTTHGKSNTRLYRLWIGMKTRCYNPNDKRYNDYGGRGIKICGEWLEDFTAFYDWAMANGYSDGLSIDRIDNNRGYSPDNCRWQTMTEQAGNKRTSRNLTLDGETHTLAEWSRITGVSCQTIYKRLERGWTIEQALRTR